MYVTPAEVFDGQEAPYGLPFISFPSAEGDSTFFVTPGHDLDKQRLIATFNFILRQYMFVPLVPMTFEDKCHEAAARFTAANPLIEQDKLTVMIETDPTRTDEAFYPVTYFEW